MGIVLGARSQGKSYRSFAVPGLPNAPITTLGRGLDRRRPRIATLTEKRQSVAERLQALGAEIADLRGRVSPEEAPVAPPPPKRPKRKAKTEKKSKPGRRPALAEAIHRVLAEADGPLRAVEIAKELKRRRVKTRSTNLTNFVGAGSGCEEGCAGAVYGREVRGGSGQGSTRKPISDAQPLRPADVGRYGPMPARVASAPTTESPAPQLILLLVALVAVAVIGGPHVVVEGGAS